MLCNTFLNYVPLSPLVQDPSATTLSEINCLSIRVEQDILLFGEYFLWCFKNDFCPWWWETNFKEDLAFSKLDTFWPDYKSKLIGTQTIPFTDLLRISIDCNIVKLEVRNIIMQFLNLISIEILFVRNININQNSL